MPSLIYNRLISISRPQEATSFGDVGYGENTGEAKTTGPAATIFTDLPATVQAQALGSTRYGSGVPGDAPGPTKWNIFIPKSAGPADFAAIKDDDIATDDAGNRYQIASAYPTILGWKLGCIRLES